MSWPLLTPTEPTAPALVPAAAAPSGPGPSRFNETERWVREDYHGILGALEQTAQPPGRQQARPRVQFQIQKEPEPEPQTPRKDFSPSHPHHFPVGTTRLLAHGRRRLVPTPSTDARVAALALATQTTVSDVLRPAGLLASDNNNNSRLLATLPLLTATAAGYVQVPLAEAVGRRPVLLLASACAWAGALWAGLLSDTPSYVQHVAARALVGIGAGAANALVPLVSAHDLVFLHQRHAALAGVVAVQGLVVAGVSAAAPVLPGADAGDPRWLYRILAAAGGAAWLAMIVLVPETRWKGRRSPAAQSGEADVEEEGANHDANKRTLWTDMGLFHVPPSAAWQGRRAGASLLDLLRTVLLPPVLWVAVLNAVLLAAQQAMTQQTVAVVAERSPGSPRTLAAAIGVPLAVAGVLAVVLAGPLATWLTQAVTRAVGRRPHNDARNEGCLREPEHNLPVLVLPLVLATAAFLVFGSLVGSSNSDIDREDTTTTTTTTITATAQKNYLGLAAATGVVALAQLLVLAGGAVYLIENVPAWAGASLAHANGLRLVAAFLLDGRTTRLAARHGSPQAWAVYAEVLVVASLGLPALLLGGRRLRVWAAGSVVVKGPKKMQDVKVVLSDERPGEQLDEEEDDYYDDTNDDDISDILPRDDRRTTRTAAAWASSARSSGTSSSLSRSFSLSSALSSSRWPTPPSPTARTRPRAI